MRCSENHSLFSFFSTLLILLPFHFLAPAAADPLWTDCSKIPSNGSTVAANRGVVFASLPSNASAATTRFANLTIGEAPNRVYGLAQCRGDTKSDACLNCLKTAGEEFPAVCPNRSGAIWYDNCFMRYSNAPILSTSDNSPLIYMWNTQNVTEPSRFSGILATMMRGLIPRATNATSGAPLYATNRTNFTSFETLYGLAQCNRNLVGNDCGGCLTDAIGFIPVCCQGKRGGRVIGVNCNIRFELYRFYEDSTTELDPNHPEPLFTECANTSTPYNADDAFGANLKSLLVSLPSEAAIAGFKVSDVGENPNQVHSLFLCRADVTPDDCRNCINTASQRLLANCSGKSAAIWYDNCFLRYSDQQILPSSTNPFVYKLWTETGTKQSSGKITSRQWSEGLWDDALHELAKSAANNTRRFAARRLHPSNEEGEHISLYGLMQCTRDLSPDECRDCLVIMNGQLRTCCSVVEGGSLLGYSCDLRVQRTKFYNDYNDTILPTAGSQQSSSTPMLAIVLPISIAVIVSLSVVIACYFRRKRKKSLTGGMSSEERPLNILGPRAGPKFSHTNLDRSDQVDSNELPWIDFQTVQSATADFSKANKLGQGGFGSVYKGVLLDGQEIAIKRLSRSSGQGIEEFKNEVTLIAKLQHRNLVRLLYCCVEGEEKLLIYEYMPNTSLDVFLFDPKKRAELDWNKRVDIARGIGRGILYLHEDSRLRIIHRDLKASNVLLDHEMNPKISDFGLARIFGGNQSEASTNRVVGTYGYMAPEYAMAGLFSVKSDVYSFGVLLLEIISGRRNTSLHFPGNAESLLIYAWKLWLEGNWLELIDPLITKTCPVNEALKCIQIGLLCVQEDAADRPTMSSVLHMFASDGTVLPQPTQPGFFVGRAVASPSKAKEGVKSSSVNEVTITSIGAR